MVRETLGSLCGALSDAACSAGSGPCRCKHHRTASVKTTAHEAGGGPVIFVARSVESVRKRWIFPAAASELRDEHGKRLYVAGTRKCPISTGLKPASRSRRAAVLLLSPQWMRSGLLLFRVRLANTAARTSLGAVLNADIPRPPALLAARE